MTRAHAVLSASGSERWLNCPPSARLEEQYPDETSVYAEEGTFAHTIAEVELRKALGQSARRPRGYAESPFWSDELETHVLNYVDLVQERAAAHQNPAVLFEVRLDFSEWVPEGFGRGDVLIVSDSTIEVIDFKYGKGVRVEAKDNSQLRLYALGAYNTLQFMYSPEKIITTIIQPRLDSISTEEMSVEALLKWAEEEVRPRAELADKGEGEFCPGDHCRWCKAKATCRARAEFTLEVARTVDFAPAPTLTNAEIAEVLEEADRVRSWVNDIQAYALEQALAGERFEGWKLVEGRSNRAYTDAEAVAQTLENEGYTQDQIYERKVLGITKMEALLGKKGFASILADLVIKPKGKPTLVPEADNRPPLAASDFMKEDK